MRPTTRCRRLILRSARCIFRPAARPALRRAIRPALRRASRQVLPDNRPSFRSICALFNKNYKRLIAYDKKRWNQGRFKMLRSPWENERKCREDLERIYGDNTVAALKLEAYALAASQGLHT